MSESVDTSAAVYPGAFVVFRAARANPGEKEMPNDHDPAKKKKATHQIVQVEPRGQNKPYQREIGYGRENTDGSIELHFQVLPLVPTYTVMLRKIWERSGEPE